MTPQPPPNGVGPGQQWPAPAPAGPPMRHRSPSERMAQGGSPLEPLERILDKGIVIDAWAEVRVLGIPLASVEARVVIASIETYLYYAESIMQLPPIARGPMAGPRAMGRVAGEAFSQEGLNPLLRATSQTVGQAGQAVTDTALGLAATTQQQEQQQDRVAALELREQAVARREAAVRRRERPAPPEPESDEGDGGEDDGDPEAPPRGERGRFARRTNG